MDMRNSSDPPMSSGLSASVFVFVSGPVALGLVSFPFGFPVLPALSEFGCGGLSSTSYCLVLSLPCCCVRLLLFLRLSLCNYLMSVPNPGRFRLSDRIVLAWLLVEVG